MFKAVSILGKKGAPHMARNLHPHQPMFFHASRRLHNPDQEHLLKNGPKMFDDHFGSENISGLEKITLNKDAALVGPLHHLYATAEKPGVFLYRLTEHNHLRSEEDADVMDGPKGPTKWVGLFKTKDSLECWQACTNEFDVGIDAAKKILIHPTLVEGAGSKPQITKLLP